MRFTDPKNKTSKFKLLALTLALLSTNMIACKSSVDEDLAPANQTEEVVADDVQMSNYSSSTVNFVSNATLKSSFSIPIGLAVIKEHLEDPIYANIVSKQFSSLSSESNMKFGALHPTQNTWTFEKADAIVAFAQKYNMRVHGHTLIWAKDSVQPDWIRNFKGDKNAWDNLLKTHIQTVLKHFKGKIASWDVINEPIASNGTLVDNIWLRKLGTDYIFKAFKYAREADPNVKLFINDYGQEFGGKKMTLLLSLVSQAKAKGIKIDGFGFQSHTVLRIDPKLFYNNFKRTADAGLLVHISEFDISVRHDMPSTFTLTTALANEQGAKWKAIVKAYLTAVPKSQQWGITMWGLSDKYSYFNKNYVNKNHDYPLLFDSKFNPKPAYKGMIEAGLGK
ncbi:MAG: endo,4-beta-xylanase [Pedobacter sp.]|jgi:endo-1,4-beta-xylanase|nr:endo,4-beta-xylanase [Pedobacter sp.]